MGTVEYGLLVRMEQLSVDTQTGNFGHSKRLGKIKRRQTLMDRPR